MLNFYGLITPAMSVTWTHALAYVFCIFVTDGNIIRKIKITLMKKDVKATKWLEMEK